MRRLIRFLSVFCVTLVVFVSAGLPAKAEATAQVDAALQSILDQQRLVEQAINRLHPYLTHRQDGTMALEVDSDVLREIGVSKEEFNVVHANMELVNQGILSGELIDDGTGQLMFKATGTPSITANENSITVKWYGYRWGFSSNLTNRIIGLATMGAGAAAIAAAITAVIPGAQLVAAALAVLAGALTLEAGWLTYLNADGRGVYIHTTFGGSILYGTSQ